MCVCVCVCVRALAAGGGEIVCVREWSRVRSKGARDCRGGWMGEWAPGLGGETTRSPSSHRERSSLAVQRTKKGEGWGGGRTATSPVASGKAAESLRAALPATDGGCGAARGTAGTFVLLRGTSAARENG